MKDNTILWVLALAEFSAIKLSAYRTHALALEALGRAATEADAWDSDGEDRFYSAIAAQQYSVAECVAGNQIRSSHLRWEIARFDSVVAHSQRNCITPLI